MNIEKTFKGMGVAARLLAGNSFSIMTDPKQLLTNTPGNNWRPSEICKLANDYIAALERTLELPPELQMSQRQYATHETDNVAGLMIDPVDSTPADRNGITPDPRLHDKFAAAFEVAHGKIVEASQKKPGAAENHSVVFQRVDDPGEHTRGGATATRGGHGW